MKNIALARRITSQRIRHSIQIFFFVLIALTAINATLAKSGIVVPFLSQASLHSLCPFGGVVSIYTLVTTGSLVQKIHESSLVLLGLVGVSSLLFGPVFCGWLCPLGSIQEWIGKLGRKLFKNHYNNLLHPIIEKYLAWIKYLVLIWVIYITAQSGQLLFAAVDPYYALFSFWSGEAAIGSLIILGLTLIGSLFVERPWCRFACPLGALLSLTNLVRIFRIRRTPSTCIHCSKCDNACPVKINISGSGIVRALSCNTCLTCTSDNACPVTDTVDLKR